MPSSINMKRQKTTKMQHKNPWTPTTCLLCQHLMLMQQNLYNFIFFFYLSRLLLPLSSILLHFQCIFLLILLLILLCIRVGLHFDDFGVSRAFPGKSLKLYSQKPKVNQSSFLGNFMRGQNYKVHWRI